MRSTVKLTAGLVSAVMIGMFATSCGDDTTSPAPPTYTATLSPASEVPAKTTTGTGTATFIDRGTQIDWTMTLTGMTNVVQSHIHGPALVGVNASVLFNLFIPNTVTGTASPLVAAGSLTNSNNLNVSLDSLRVLFNNGNAYVNVHTSANQGGEIRGQISRSP
jgi:hypothetical protein